MATFPENCGAFIIETSYLKVCEGNATKSCGYAQNTGATVHPARIDMY